MSPYEKPVPVPTELTKEFWSATKEHKLKIQRCKDCKEHIFYPRSLCPHCLSSNLEWVEASGEGTVHTFTVIYRPPSEAFKKDVPYCIAIVDLKEGPRMMTNIVGCKPEDIKIGMKVKVAFEDITENIALPKFKPV